MKLNSIESAVDIAQILNDGLKFYGEESTDDPEINSIGRHSSSTDYPESRQTRGCALEAIHDPSASDYTSLKPAKSAPTRTNVAAEPTPGDKMPRLAKPPPVSDGNPRPQQKKSENTKKYDMEERLRRDWPGTLRK